MTATSVQLVHHQSCYITAMIVKKPPSNLYLVSAESKGGGGLGGLYSLSCMTVVV